jgi:hypothetical protein
MRILIAVLLGLAGGFLVGIVISQIVGIAGVFVFHQAIGIKFLPIYTAIVGAIAAPLLAGRIEQNVR